MSNNINRSNRWLPLIMALSVIAGIEVVFLNDQKAE